MALDEGGIRREEFLEDSCLPISTRAEKRICPRCGKRPVHACYGDTCEDCWALGQPRMKPKDERQGTKTRTDGRSERAGEVASIFQNGMERDG